MSKVVGIVACSPPGAALCYETICVEAGEIFGRHGHPQVLLHAFNFAEHVELLEAGDWDGIARLMLASVRKLAAAGADFAVCPDNTIHQALPSIEDASPISWLHIADAVIDAARERGLKRLAILGTRYLMEGPVYTQRIEAAGLEWRIPESAQRAEINRIIFDELVFGRVEARSQRALSEIIGELETGAGCDGAILGCTELPLAVTPQRSPLPVLDSTRLLARAAIRRASEVD